MSAGGWFDNLDAKQRLDRLTAKANVDRLAPLPRSQPWLSRWRCRLGWHDWREVEMPDRDKRAECTRCGKREWRRLLQNTSGQWRGGDPAAGAGGS